MTFGLVCDKTHPWLATSVDGLTVLSINDGEDDELQVEVPIEIKTFSGSDSEDYIRDISDTMSHFIICSFGDDTFKKAIKNIGYRIQLLHHATVFKSKYAIFVAATKDTIKFSVLVKFSDENRSAYFQMLNSFVTTNLAWISSENGIIPDDIVAQLTDKGLSRPGYHIDVESVCLHFALRQKCYELVKQKRRPLPKCKLLVPKAIAYWNSRKGHIDIFSRLLSHVKIPFGKQRQHCKWLYSFLCHVWFKVI